MAEGFIAPVDERRLEDIGKDYFKDLLSRSFFQCLDDNPRNPKICKMHDLIHYLAQSISEGICFRIQDDISQWYPGFRNVRYLSISYESKELLPPAALPGYHSLRTFILLCKRGRGIQLDKYDLFLRFRILRVLSLDSAGIVELPDSIDHLKHLRYFNLSGNNIRKLPRTITKLLVLQTIKLRHCSKLVELPKNFKNLTNLRHLDLDIKRQLAVMPFRFGRLVNLQTLHAFIVGRGEGYGIRELQDMRILRGALCIKNLERVTNLTEAKKAVFGKKPFLDKLELEWNTFTDNIHQDGVLAGLEPHENLKEIVITNYGGNMFPNWISKPRHSFSSIHLKGCKHCSILPPLGQLQLLKFLLIEDMSSLVEVDRRFCGSANATAFPILQSLKFRNMANWIEWSGLSQTDMPCLRELTFECCFSLVCLPSLNNLGSLTNLEINACPKLKELPNQLPDSLRNLIILECDLITDRCRWEMAKIGQR